MAVPYSESNSQATDVDLVQTDINSRQPLIQSVLDTPASHQGTENMNWPNPSVSSAEHPIASNQILSSFQNQPLPMQLDSISQSNSPLSGYQESNLGFQNTYPPQPTAPPTNNFPYNTAPVMTTSFPSYSEKSSEYHITSSDYYSQPPVITPSAAPVYYNTSGKHTPQTNLQIPQANFSNISSPSYNMHSSSMASEMYSRIYEPVKPYWLFRDIIETKEIWCGFSKVDSDRLELAFQQDPQAIVAVDGGRYDAIISERIKKPVYFEAKDLQIRRCTWFYRPDSSQRFIPFPEEASSLLEQHYSTCVTSGQWQKRINLPGIGSVVFESPQLLLHYKNDVELWPTLPDSKASPKTVKRGFPENFEILASENNRIDHLVFIVQGIGSFCDLRFRTVTECVDGFRDISNKLLSSHFRHETESGQVGRIEFLPLAWHAKLHTSDKGFDRCMQNITLPSIPKLRHFTNDTLLDILLYSSPFYCQSIIDTVASELNKLYEMFLKRNSGFSGKVFVAGHSLGSLILFDILANQKLEDSSSSMPINELNCDKVMVMKNEKPTHEDSVQDAFDSITNLLQACQLEEYVELFESEKIDLSSVAYLSDEDLKNLGIPTGHRKKLLNAVHLKNQVNNMSEKDENVSESTGVVSNDQNNTKEYQGISTESKNLIYPFKTSPCMQSIVYPRLHFEPAGFFALGSPISMFLSVRGYDSISDDFRFPTCPNFFHIFHPYDPVAFRIEPLIDHNFSVKPVLIPHHKGRKRMHLEIRENLSKVGFEIKQRVLETLKSTWNSLSGFAKAHTFPSAAVEAEVDKLVNQQMSESEYEQQAPSETSGEEIQIGSLNGGRRIDYVLQEKPIEALNDYIFALTSHSTYWDSEDTVLMILREIYATQGILVSSQSILENRQLNQPEQSSHNVYPPLSSVMSNPCLYDNTKVEHVPSSASNFYNQSIPPVIPGSSQSVHSFNSYNAPVSQVTNNVPLPSSTAVSQQPVGPPPLTGFVKRSPFAR